MPRTARFSRQSSLPIVLAMVAFVLGAFVQLGLARPYALGGVLLDRELRIAPGSSLPSEMLQVGDRLVAIDPDGVTGTQSLRIVTDRREVALRVGAAQGTTISVSIERQGTVERLEVRPEDLGPDLPTPLRGTWRIERIDGQPVSGEIGLDELRFLAEQAAPRAIAVDVRVSGSVQGPVDIQRIRPDMFGVAWLVLTMLAVIGVLLGSARSPRSLAPDETLRLASLLVGGLAAGAAASALLDGLTPVWVGVWYVALAAGWRAIAMLGHLHAIGDDPEGPLRTERVAATLALPVLFGLACPAVVFLAVQPDAAAPLRSLSQLEAAGVAVFGAYLLADAALLFRLRAVAPRGALVASGASLVIGCIGAATLLLPGEVAMGSLAAGTLLACIAAGWVGELFDSLRAPEATTRRSTRDGEEGGAVDILRRIAAMCEPRSSALAVGSGGEFVLVRGVDRTGGGIEATDVSKAPATLADALTMLATEGGMFPRAEGDAELDAFAGLAERIGFAAAIPLRPAAGANAIDVFLVVLDDADGPLPDPAALAFELDRCDATLLYAELGVLASAELIAEARRRVAHAEAAPVSTAPTPPVAPAQPAPVPVARAAAPDPGALAGGRGVVRAAADRSAARWAEWLETQQTYEFPVDDPEALTAEERGALRGLAASDGAVLLLGEPGVGKEFVARAIHDASARREERFLTVDCSLLPPAVVEFELFGDDDSVGLVELVGRGSLLLKSASSLPASVLDGVLSRLDRAGGRLFVAERYRGPDPGVPETVPVSIRRRVENRTLHLAPLRDRPEDLPRLARWFLHREAMRYDFVSGARTQEAELLPDAVAALRRLDLPGNFRELRTVLSAALLRSDSGAIRAVDLGVPPMPSRDVPAPVAPDAPAPAAPSEDDDSGADIDRAAILDALSACQGNRTLAAQRLGVTRGKLLRQMKKLGIQ